MVAVYPWDITISTTRPDDSADERGRGRRSPRSPSSAAGPRHHRSIHRRDHRRLFAQARAPAGASTPLPASRRPEPASSTSVRRSRVRSRSRRSGRRSEQPGDGRHRHVEAVHGEMVAATRRGDSEHRDREDPAMRATALFTPEETPASPGPGPQAPSSSAGRPSGTARERRRATRGGCPPGSRRAPAGG